jgi:hypothetical protein
VALSEKGKVARVLDKRKDSAEVVVLIERLQHAILIYQVCSENSPHGRGVLTFGADDTRAGCVQPYVPVDRELQPLSSCTSLNWLLI